MIKKNISSLELVALVRELQCLIPGKLPHIYHQKDEALVLQFHTSSAGKHLLRIFPGKWLCLTKSKEAVSKPSNFCMLLRKYLDNASVRALYQKDAQRIVVMELEKKEKFYLIVELFSKGNVILTDDQYMIIGSLERQMWKDRAVKQDERYIFPVSEVNWKTLDEKMMGNVLKKSIKKNLATSLATDLNFGGVYAEEICLRAGIDKNKVAVDLSSSEVKLLFRVMQEFKKLVLTPRGYIYADNVTPFPLQGQKIVEEKPTYNEAIDLINPLEKTSPYEKKINALRRMLVEQEGACTMLEEKIAENTRKGELIYEKYIPLQKLLAIVAELRKTEEWATIGQELQKEKKIRDVDLKNKKITIDL